MNFNDTFAEDFGFSTGQQPGRPENPDPWKWFLVAAMAVFLWMLYHPFH